jgi:lysophospholipid acyltransferase (LPLAT)-like uncharacterized protein
MKKLFKDLTQTRFFAFILQLIVRIIYLTNKKVYNYTDALKDESIIVAMWHGDLLMQPLNYRAFRPKGEVKVIVSEHRDGKIIKTVVEYLGVGAIDVSSSKGGAKALITAIKSLKKGIDIAITPDGPRGPLYSVADGIVAISQKTKAKIVPFSCIPSSYWQFDSWDKFIVPKPFGTIEFFVGEPFDVNDLSMDEAKRVIQNKLMENQLDK